MIECGLGVVIDWIYVVNPPHSMKGEHVHFIQKRFHNPNDAISEPSLLFGRSRALYQAIAKTAINSLGLPRRRLSPLPCCFRLTIPFWKRMRIADRVTQKQLVIQLLVGCDTKTQLLIHKA